MIKYFKFLSLRRYYLDFYLNQHKNLMKGHVLDIGGKKDHPKGEFIPPKSGVDKWEYLNSDRNENPDILSDVENIPLKDKSIDTIIMTEVLEYLGNPMKALFELNRILSNDGNILISIPFMHPIHGDFLDDRARYTNTYLTEIFKKVGLNIVKIKPMGSVCSVIFDILRVTFSYANKTKINTIVFIILHFFRPLFLKSDKLFKTQRKYINTGYFIVLKKKEKL